MHNHFEMRHKHAQFACIKNKKYDTKKYIQKNTLHPSDKGTKIDNADYISLFGPISSH